MFKDSPSPRYAVRRTHRTYSAQFKTDLVAACLRPGASIAALALQHGMNANVLHRWLKEYGQGRHRCEGASDALAVTVSEPPPAFIPITLGAPAHAEPPQPTQDKAATADIRIECQRDGLCVSICWPLAAANECIQMLREVLR